MTPRQPAPEPPDRRAAILAAALECFNAAGIEGAGIGDVAARAGASIGSIYHHFGSKEGVAVALLAEGLRGNARQLEQRLAGLRTARQGVRALVESLVDWIVAHPDWARFIYTVSASRLVPAGGDALREVGQYYAQVLDGYFGPHWRAGTLRRLPGEVFPSLVVGPVHDYARRWLNGQASTPIGDYVELFFETAWNAVRVTR